MITVDSSVIGMIWGLIITISIITIPISLFDLPHKEKRVRAIILIALMLAISVSSTAWIRREAHVSKGTLIDTDITVDEVDSITVRYVYIDNNQLSIKSDIDAVELNNDTYENVVVTAEEHYITHAKLLGLKIDITRTNINKSMYVNEYVYNALNSDDIILYERQQEE